MASKHRSAARPVCSDPEARELKRARAMLAEAAVGTANLKDMLNAKIKKPLQAQPMPTFVMGGDGAGGDSKGDWGSGEEHFQFSDEAALVSTTCEIPLPHTHPIPTPKSLIPPRHAGADTGGWRSDA